MRVKNLNKQIEISKKIYTSRFDLSLIYVISARRVTFVIISIISIISVYKTSFASVMKVKKEYICF